MSDKILYVTGCDAAYFPIACTLLGAFATFAPGKQMWVCDFGLSKGQQAFFRRKGVLLPKPPELPEERHVYFYKGSLGHYVARLDFDLLVWIDADCVVAGPIDLFFSRLAQQQGPQTPFVAACPDPFGHTTATFIAEYQDELQPFAQLMQGLPAAADKPYLSCGIFAIRSRPTLMGWAETVALVPPHFLFDQNTFNVAVYRTVPNLLLLNTPQWNVSGDGLNDLHLNTDDQGNATVHNGEHRVMNIHLSDGKEQQAVKLELLNLNIAGRYFVGFYRGITAPRLQKWVSGFLSTYIFKNPENLRILLESGALLEHPLTLEQLTGSPLEQYHAVAKLLKLS